MLKEGEVEVMLERAKENDPEAERRIISDNGPQFIARTLRSLLASRARRTSEPHLTIRGRMESWIVWPEC